MKNSKYIVKVFNQDGISLKSEIKYKSFREIEKELGLEYHIIRELNRITEIEILRLT